MDTSAGSTPFKKIKKEIKQENGVASAKKDNKPKVRCKVSECRQSRDGNGTKKFEFKLEFKFHVSRESLLEMCSTTVIVDPIDPTSRSYVRSISSRILDH